jgi:uncharacterized protein YecT (DUF1311 family)
LGTKQISSCLKSRDNETPSGPTTASRVECTLKLANILSTELNHVYHALQEIFQEHPTILKRLEVSQKAWEKFCKAELELHCPSNPDWCGSEFMVSTNYIMAYLYRDRLNMLTPLLLQYP